MIYKDDETLAQIDEHGQVIETHDPNDVIEQQVDNRKIIQLILNDEGVPVIQYANVNVSECLGALEIAKTIFEQKKITLPLIKDAMFSGVGN